MFMLMVFRPVRVILVPILAIAISLSFANPVSASGPPQYEPAYVSGETVMINAIEVKQNAGVLQHAAADFYEVVYPIDWQSRSLSTPQCHPCDHEGNGIDFTDFHDHILDSMPSSPGHGEYNPNWHVFVVLPAYSFLTGGNPANDPAIAAAYASYLPTRSEAAVDALLSARLGGLPIAIEIDTHFYFICAVVNAHAAK
jgi:hypothetical protein